MLFLNDDVFVNDEAVRALVSALDRRPSAVAAAARLVDPDDGSTRAEYLPQPLPDARFPWWRCWRVASAQPRRAERRRDGGRRPASGPASLVRRGAIDDAGGWDEDFEF